MTDFEIHSPTRTITVTETYGDSHPPLSPATPAESFFLPQLRNIDISAYALANNLRESERKLGRRSANTSINTEDFQTCAENIDDINSDERKSIAFTSPIPEIYTSDSQDIELDFDTPEKTFKTTMADSTSFTKQGMNIDPSQHIYGGIKNVWEFGSNFPITKPFAKVTEKVAEKVLNMATGMEFSGVDAEIKPKLAELDSDLLNPTITKIVNMVEPIITKAHIIVEPVAVKLLTPFGLFDHPKLEDKKPEDTLSSEEKMKDSESATPEISLPQVN